MERRAEGMRVCKVRTLSADSAAMPVILLVQLKFVPRGVLLSINLRLLSKKANTHPHKRARTLTLSVGLRCFHRSSKTATRSVQGSPEAEVRSIVHKMSCQIPLSIVLLCPVWRR